MCMGHCLIFSHVVGVGVGLPLLIICIALMWAALLGFNHFSKKRQGRYRAAKAEEADVGYGQSIDGAKLDSLQKTTEVTVQTSFTEHGTIENEKRTTIMQKRIKVHRCIVLRSGNGRVSYFDA